jgi:histidinol-phosphate aminotransferase
MDHRVENLPDGVVALIDEVYYHFNELVDFPYANDYIKKGHAVIGMHSFSKAYGLAGIRLAYGFASLEIAEYLQKLRRPFFINTMSMEAGLAALKDVDHIRATQNLIKEQKHWLYGEFERLGLRYWPSHTNFILVRPDEDHEALIQRLLSHGVMVRSGDNNGAKKCIRITIGLPESNQALVMALEAELS